MNDLDGRVVEDLPSHTTFVVILLPSELRWDDYGAQVCLGRRIIVIDFAYFIADVN